MRRIALLVAAGLVLAGAIGYTMIANGGLGADRTPGRVEAFVANRALHLSIPSDRDRATNPHRADEAAWREAAPIFAERCSMCHGADGRGHSDLGPRMYPRVPDLADADVQAFSDGALFTIMQTGIRMTGMPGFKGIVSDDDTWKLVSFVRRVPTLTPEQLESAHASHASHAAAATGPTITMDGTRFHPDDLSVPVGATITFVNKDFFPHNVRSDSAGWRSGSMDPDTSWSVRVEKPGDFAYVCTLHPGMKGIVRVR